MKTKYIDTSIKLLFIYYLFMYLNCVLQLHEFSSNIFPTKFNSFYLHIPSVVTKIGFWVYFFTVILKVFLISSVSSYFHLPAVWLNVISKVFQMFNFVWLNLLFLVLIRTPFYSGKMCASQESKFVQSNKGGTLSDGEQWQTLFQEQNALTIEPVAAIDNIFLLWYYKYIFVLVLVRMCVHPSCLIF